jgi:tetratricopeptide (TPR) repeat protein
MTLGAILLTAPAAAAAAPWHLQGWQARAVVEVIGPAEAGVDTAGVKVLCQGQARPDGNDYRVLDAAGKSVPFQLMFHDAARYSLISFRAADPRQRFFVYFGNSAAARAAEQVAGERPPGSGPPQGAWVPHDGLVLETIQRPEGPNPRTADDMARLIAGSRAKYGARYQRRISDGYNPFGPSDYYISIYRGWITVPAAGKYRFCTISNEASFSFLDGKPLVHWPGRHTVERGIHGEKNALVELSAGRHYIEYYHEEVTLEQMAFLGWRPSAGPGPFAPIPETVYTAPHEAAVTRYESRQGPLVRFEPVLTDSVWPEERHEGQYTRCRFRAGQRPPLPRGTAYRWDFGDGQTAAGPAAEHVYLALGTYNVTLTAQGPAGTASARWPLEVFEIDHVTDQFKEGVPKDYARLARTYDRGHLDAVRLRELAYLLAEADEPGEAVVVGNEWARRFASSQPKLAPRVRRLVAECCLRTDRGGADEAIANYRASLTGDTPPAERLDVLARLIRLIGIERDLPDKAAQVLGEAESAVRGARMDEETGAAYRRAVIAAGDVLLWHGKREQARELYLRAEERLSSHPIPPHVRAARVGAYPHSVRDLIAGGNYGSTLDLLDRWEETFPTEKLSGQTFFWRGKVLGLRGQPRQAARYLARAIALAGGAAFESESRWLLAQALQRLGRTEDARRELAKLVASGIQDEFTRAARDQLQACRRSAKP